MNEIAVRVKGLMNEYEEAFRLLDQYDHAELDNKDSIPSGPCSLTPEVIESALAELSSFVASRHEGDPGLLVNADAKVLQDALAAVNQSYGGKELYPSIEEKAAHMLYFVVKGHRFVDGNKRMGAFAMLLLMDALGMLHKTGDSPLLSPRLLAALTVLVAESRSSSKEDTVKLLAALLRRH